VKLFAPDLVLLHPPTVYDFRDQGTMFGPISDVVPSSPVFEMYPMGLTTIASTLEDEGFNVQIVNVAYRMLRDRAYDAEAEITRLDPMLFGIDLHWLPHAQGALELARLVKQHHPDTPVIFGGLSASYYHEELLRYPDVDMVMRGDSTEEPMRRLMHALRFGDPLADVPNLSWKTADGTPVVNPLDYVPDSIDDIPLPNYSYVIRSVFKYGSLANVIPCMDWLDYPITAVLTARGCTQNCAICGGARTAYRNICHRMKPAFRSPEVLVQDILRIQQFSNAPIFLVHDLRQGGKAHADRFFELLSKVKVRNELVFELFFPADDAFMRQIARAVPRFSIEMTLESHLEELRRVNGKFACSNAAVEETIASALRHGVNRLDVFFMVGIPKQTYADAVDAVQYCRRLLGRFDADRRLWFFIAPLGPFLDPGSPAFEHPERFGYRRFCTTLEDHRRAIMAPTWKHMLSFETDAMTRGEIVDATYEAGLRLAELKRDFGMIDQETYDDLAGRIATSRRVIAEVDEILELGEPVERERRLAAVRERIDPRPSHEVSAKEWLKWPIRRRYATIPRLVKVLVGLAATEGRLFLRRRLRLYFARRARTAPSAGTARAAPPVTRS